MSMVKFFSKVLRVFMMTVSDKIEINDWASISVCLLVATALDKMHL